MDVSIPAGDAGPVRPGLSSLIPPEVRVALPAIAAALVRQGLPATKVADALADAFGVSRSAIWKATKLRSQ